MGKGKSQDKGVAPAIDPKELIERNHELLRKVGGSLGDDLIDAYDQLRELEEASTWGQTLYYWRLGQYLQSFREAEAAAAAAAQRAPTHKGSRALAEVLHAKANAVKAAEHLIAAYPTEDELMVELQEPRANGKVLPWSMMKQIVQPSVAPVRAQVLTLARQRNWTQLDLKMYLDQRANRTAGQKVGGRPIHPPKNLLKGLAKWIKLNGSWISYGKEVFKDPVLDQVLANTDPADLSPAALKGIDQTRSQLSDMVDLANTELAAIDKLRAKVAAAIGGKAAPAPPAAAAPPPATAARKAARALKKAKAKGKAKGRKRAAAAS